jgi:hypothetical protein
VCASTVDQVRSALVNKNSVAALSQQVVVLFIS